MWETEPVYVSNVQHADPDSARLPGTWGQPNTFLLKYGFSRTYLFHEEALSFRIPLFYTILWKAWRKATGEEPLRKLPHSILTANILYSARPPMQLTKQKNAKSKASSQLSINEVVEYSGWNEGEQDRLIPIRKGLICRACKTWYEQSVIRYTCIDSIFGGTT